MIHTDAEESSPSRTKARYTMSGLEFMQKVMRGELPPIPMGELIEFRLAEVGEGYAVFTIEPHERYYNGLGIAHGGMAATLLDSAMGCAINTLASAGRVFTTLEMNINYIRPMKRETGEVRCEASVVHVGDHFASAKGQIVDREGRLYAHGTTTCILFRP
jgi:uncharacterized protein (TIGR00369 family)